METNHHITERERLEEALHLNELREHALLELDQMTGQPMQMISDFALEKALALTRSQTGYLAFLNADETLLTMRSWPKDATEQSAIEIASQTHSVAEADPWAEAVLRRRPVIANKVASADSVTHGEADSATVRHIDVPVFEGERIVVMAGVGSKQTPYDEVDVRQLMLLMLGLWRLLQREQTEDRLRSTAEALRRRISRPPCHGNAKLPDIGPPIARAERPRSAEAHGRSRTPDSHRLPDWAWQYSRVCPGDESGSN